MVPSYVRRVPRCRKKSGVAWRWRWGEGGGNDNSQYKPTTQIDASNLLGAIREAGGDRRYRRYESKSERDEGTARQHFSVKLEKVLDRGKGIRGSGKENWTLEVFYGK